ncbi:MAG: J domain-containing protein [Xanthobacteraceae bacterium]|nr:J domain-containing protein [Xanthobacteraceae bacterium]
MKFDSPLFDRIRVKPTEDRTRKPDEPCCQWKGCGNTATHRAPKGRNHENEYWRFCLDHVREYNSSYNYFSGMSDDAVMKYQKDAVTGHRPTWKMGTGTRQAGGGDFGPHAPHDPFNVFREFGARGADTRTRSERAEPARMVRNAERKALHELGLEEGADKAEIKARFKILVKRHHPDANGGDRAMEDKLREIIQAYNYLKSVGAV